MLVYLISHKNNISILQDNAKYFIYIGYVEIDFSFHMCEISASEAWLGIWFSKFLLSVICLPFKIHFEHMLQHTVVYFEDSYISVYIH